MIQFYCKIFRRIKSNAYSYLNDYNSIVIDLFFFFSFTLDFSNIFHVIVMKLNGSDIDIEPLLFLYLFHKKLKMNDLEYSKYFFSKPI